jgi:hypothetical protein
VFQGPPRERERLTWLFFAGWVLLIFVAVPIAPRILKHVGEIVPLGSLVYATIAVILIATVIAVAYIFKSLKGRRQNLFWLILTLGIYVYFCLYETKTPQEALHFLEYGFLGLLAFRALSHRIRDVSIYWSAVMLVAVVGTVDEIIQWMTPGRYYDFHDIRFDTLSAALAQLVLARGMRPPFIQWAVKPASVRLACRLTILLLGLFTFTVLNTPIRVVAYAGRIPGMSYLLDNYSIMNEFGYRHTDRDIGTFYSRFPTADLRRIDQRYGDRVGRRLAEIKARDGNLQSLQTLKTAGTTPFIHEAALHLSRRDHYAGAMWKYTPGTKRHLFHQSVAYRENQVLEHYFGRSLTNSGMLRTPEELELWKASLASARPFRSQVSSHLVTRLRSSELLGVLLSLMIFFFAIDRFWGRERPDAATGA